MVRGLAGREGKQGGIEGGMEKGMDGVRDRGGRGWPTVRNQC